MLVVHRIFKDKKNMSSLFHLWRNFDSAMLKLPAVCVPGGETDTLRAKREAQLKWMRERGVRYLGNPMVWPDRRARGSPIAPNRGARAPFEGLAIERPGDAIARDLASTDLTDTDLASNG
jgi:hypothetical protein